MNIEFLSRGEISNFLRTAGYSGGLISKLTNLVNSQLRDNLPDIIEGMLLYKVNMTFDLGDTAIKGSGYVSSKPESFSDISHLIPKWVFEFCKSREESIIEIVDFHSLSLTVSEKDIIDLLNSYDSYSIHDIYEE